MRIALIVGHSKESQGAVNKKSMTTEFNYNNRLVPLISESLTELGVDNVIVYRDSYAGLPKKVNATGADIAIEFHANAALNLSATGSETLYWHTSEKGKELAQSLQNQVIDCLNLRNRGLKPITPEGRGAHLLRKTAMPCVILEPFFISNDDDLKHAEDQIERLAEAVVVGVSDYAL